MARTDRAYDGWWRSTRDLDEMIEDVEESFEAVATPVHTGHWQGLNVEGRPDFETLELTDQTFRVRWVPYTVDKLRYQCRPSLPWADEHFEERVSRVPSNPGESYKNWPWYSPGADDTARAEGRFTHTYQERFWPRRAGHDSFSPPHYTGVPDNRGIRYDLGDLDDLVNLLLQHPYTRQAWLPIFFPEDTGAVHGGRIPCTIGYQFLLREEKLHMWYVIRSCDLIRHFRDDVYLACRLLLWVLEELQGITEPSDSDFWQAVTPGSFTMHCFSLHAHKGDLHAPQS
jgi:hypothetical protein